MRGKFVLCLHRNLLIDQLDWGDILSALQFGVFFFNFFFPGERLKNLNIVVLFILVLSNSEFLENLMSMFYYAVMES